jgi:molybdopterin synthase sulfur carrier subunit
MQHPPCCERADDTAGTTLVRLRVPRNHGVMARVYFTPQLRRFTATPEVETTASTLREALEAAFVVNPQLRGYVLDDQGHLRVNVVCFVDGRRCTERVHLSDPLHTGSRVHVLQALSGG